MEQQAAYITGSTHRVTRVVRVIRDKDWRTKVYMHQENQYPENWDLIRREIIKRDQYTCYRCELHEPRMAGLTVHHLIPRAEGGKENPENLITLCYACHDFVEVQGYRTKAQIIGSYEGDTVNYNIKQSREERGKARSESFDRPSWHQKVYGGRKSN